MKPFSVLPHAVRAKEILTVLARHGFAEILAQIGLPAGLQTPAAHRSTAERIRLAAEELGPTFVKLGQLLSMRPDVVPHDIILELRKLQDGVSPLPFPELRPVLEAALARPVGEVFVEFNETAIASASLAQVYFARLRDGNLPVAVKIQKPDLERRMAADFDMARWLAGLLQERIKTLQSIDLKSVLEEAQQGILRELDFGHEARNQEFFNSLNPHPDRVFAPKVVTELSSERVLVMEQVSGTPVASASALPPDVRRRLAGIGADSIAHQIFVAGFFHADPHSGNIFVTGDGRLCFLDWGLAGHLTGRSRHALADFWCAAVAHDSEQIARIGMDLASADAQPELRSLEKEITIALREELNFALGHQALGRAMLRLLFIFGHHGIPLSREYSFVAKAVLCIEEVGRLLDPGFDLRRHTEPILGDLRWERVNLDALSRRLRQLFRQSLAGLQDVPSEFRRLIRRLHRDNLVINVQHRGLEAYDDAVKIAANRIALGVIIGALIIGSSMIVTTGISPHLFGYPALGIVGYLLSALLGLYVVYDIIRHGRHK